MKHFPNGHNSTTGEVRALPLLLVMAGFFVMLFCLVAATERLLP